MKRQKNTNPLNVLITCSGTGSRVKDYAPNKALIKLGDRPIISHIINMYPKNSKFYITLGHNKQILKDYLNITHKDYNITFINVDKYDGPGSSLLYSISIALPYINDEFYFNTCDTLILNKKITKKHKYNLIFTSNSISNNQYRKVLGKNNNLFISDEKSINSELSYIGISYIYDYKNYKLFCNDILSDNPSNSNLSDVHVLNKLKLKSSNINNKNWIDTGNSQSISKALNKFSPKINSLKKENTETYLDNNLIIKFYDDKNIINNLYHQWEYIDCCLPEQLNIKENFIFYPFINGNTLSNELTPELLVKFLNWAQSKLWKLTNSNYSSEFFFDNFYIKKTINRVQKFIEKNPQFLYVKNINNKNCNHNIYDLINLIPDKIKKQSIFSKIHGDLVFENVILSPPCNFTLIDWRPGFLDNYGDIYYDLAKMHHNLIFNHLNISKKLYNININKNNYYVYNLKAPEQNSNLLNILNNWCDENSYSFEVIKHISALIQLSSSGLHQHEEAQLLFLIGFSSLNDLIA